MTIKECFIMRSGNACPDVDVSDTELDILVAFCYDEDMDKSEDAYDRFISLLANRVNISSWCGENLVCDFSGFAKDYNDKIRDTMIKNGGYFEFPDPEDAYLNFVSDLEGLISGCGNDSTYNMWLEVFK